MLQGITATHVLQTQLFSHEYAKIVVLNKYVNASQIQADMYF